MAETSYLWNTNGTGDGKSGGYNQADWGIIAKILGACVGYEGVAPGYRSELLPAANGANTVSVAAGGALVDGKPYDSSASVNVNIPSAQGAGNTRYDRITLRATWSSQTVRIFRVEGLDAGSPTIPAPATSVGSLYDVTLATVLVNTSGAVTVTDARTKATMPAGLITGTQLVAGTLTPTQVANRSRYVPIGSIWPVVSGTGAMTVDSFPDSVISAGTVHFRVPADYISSGHFHLVGYGISGTGNARWQYVVYAGALGEVYTHDTIGPTLATVAVPAASAWGNVLDIDLSAIIVPGDCVEVWVSRLGSDGADSYSGVVMGAPEFSYVADS